MKNRNNKSQRQEVRRILAAVRQELKDYRLEYEDLATSRPMVRLDEVITKARNQVRGEADDQA